ncbi:MAG: carboxypeptidase regulatory-like domain-containing protein [Acidobacteriota bacterium]
MATVRGVSAWGIRLCLVCLLLSAAAMLRAQAGSGVVRGSVRNSSGAPVAGATIAVRVAASRLLRSAVTDAQGRFLLQALPPGVCEITATAPGFAAAKARIVVSMSTTLELAVTLGTLPAAESVTVRANASSIAEQPIDLTSDVHQSVITSRDLATLPLAARSFANIAYLAPGTEPVEPSDPTKARITAVSTGGSSGLNNELSVDGADNSDDYIGGFLENYSPDAINEFVVATAQEDAATGGTTAGSVILDTKSGTNHWHGLGAFYERAAALNARFPIENPAPDPKQPFSRQNYVATLGGPILRDRLWFFASAEYVHENASIVYSPANAAQFDALATLASDGLIPGVSSIAVPAFVPIPFRDTLGMLRFDWTQSRRSTWFLRNSVDTYTTHNDMVQQATLPSTGLLTHNNYFSLALGNQFEYSPTLVGKFLFGASGLHLTQTRSSDLGFALAFPFSSTSLTVSGFETFGDNQFATPITFFPSERDQQKYQLRYDVSKALGSHSIQFGVNLIHEPVLGGRFPGNTETLYQFPQNPSYYLEDPAQFTADMQAGASTTNLGGGFAQNVQRFAGYAQDSWQARRGLTLNYGVRSSATRGLFVGSGRTQMQNPGYSTLAALQIPLVTGAPHDDDAQIAPRVGFAWAPSKSGSTVVRGGFGIYYDDLAQNGWVTAFQTVSTGSGACVDPVQNPNGPENPGCVAGSAAGGVANLIDPHYRTPYAIHISAGAEHAFNGGWALSADFVHEQGNHSYRAYSYTGGANLFTPLLAADDPRQAQVVPDVNVFHSDNRSSYSALLVHLQGRVNQRLNLVANYTLAKAQTWGCVLGELFDYVNGVCDPLDPFAPGDYGPSGEDVRHRAVVAGVWRAWGGFELSTVTQAETARPFTITTADNSGRIAIDGRPTSLDQFRGTPYIQADLRVSRPMVHERWTVTPLVEFFNVFNRNNPGANYVTNIATLPVPAAEAQSGNVTEICTNADCSATTPIISPDQLRVPGGALGDFFGPGTTVGIPFAAQGGARVSF